MPAPVFSSSDYERFYRAELGVVHPAGPHRLRANCPVHGGDSFSLSIDLATGFAKCFKCHADGEAWDMIQFAMARHGLSKQCARDYVHAVTGVIKKPSIAPWPVGLARPLTITDNDWRLGVLARRITHKVEQLNNEPLADTGLPDPNWEPYALYTYESVKCVKVRIRNRRTGQKQMLWLALTPQGGWMIPSKLGLQVPPYRAATLKDAQVIWLLNGEKAVDRAVADWNVAATCLPNGEGKWKDEYLPWFDSAQVIYVVIDNDATGRKHGDVVGGALARAGKQARIVALPGLPEKGDLYDFIEAGGTLAACLEIAGGAPVAEATQAPPAEERTRAHRNGRNGDGPPPDDITPAVALPAEPDLVPFDLNDTGNSKRLIACLNGSARYCFVTRSWHIWNGRCWAAEPEGIYAQAIAAMELLKRQANEGDSQLLWGFANRSQNLSGLNNMIAIARGYCAIDIGQFDNQPHLIPCQNGTFDLTTGTLREHRREDFITRLFPFSYDPALPLPQLFLRTLDELMGGGPDASDEALDHATRMIDYLQKVFGYALTGYINAKAFFCFWGETGNNGKTLLLTLLADVMGEYAVRIDPLTLTASSKQGDSNKKADMARMKGARVAIASEPPGNEKFDQGALKLLTQGEAMVSATFKHRDPFQYWPTAKILLESNSVPRIDTTDRAFLNRFHLIEHAVEIPPERIDDQLRAKLAGEMDAIFSWMVAGALYWRDEGLERPLGMQQVIEIIKQENADADNLGPWLAECFDLGPNLSCAIAEIEQSQHAWAERHRQRCFNRVYLSKRLCLRPGISRVVQKGQRKTVTRLQGLCPKEAPAAAARGKDAQFKDDPDD